MRIAVIGGGAAGLIAAGSAKGADVVLFEHNDKIGRKIYITGKGRCNFTNVCEPDEFLQNVVTNPRFLRGALYGFTPSAAIELLESNGCKTKVERGRRAFPLSDKASDVTKALQKYALSNSVDIRTNCDITEISKNDGSFTVVGNGVSERFDRLIMCTGGVSYPMTGSDGSSHRFIKAFGHTIVEPVPSLVPLVTKENISSAEGLTLKNVTVKTDGVKPIFGDLMITDNGVSGPIILTLSAYLARKAFPYTISIDLKPKIDENELDERLLRDFGAKLNKQFKNSLDELLPKSIIPFIISRSGISPEKQVNSITRAERRTLVTTLKDFKLTIMGSLGFNHAVVTSGGVAVNEINPKTMQSKLVDGLFFGGEIIDVDALTGGYNFHIALATGYAAGVNSAVTNE